MLDLVLHAIGGVACAAAVLWLPPSVAAVVFAATLGIAREWDQRPGKWPWRWSPHAWIEAASWPLGAVAAVGVYALLG